MTHWCCKHILSQMKTLAMFNIIIDITQQHWNPGWCSLCVCHVVLSTSCVSLFLLFFSVHLGLSHSSVFLSVFFPQSLLVCLFCSRVYCVSWYHLPVASSCIWRLCRLVNLVFAFCLYLVCFFCSWIAPVLLPDFLPARCLNYSNFGLGLALWFCIWLLTI